MDINVYSIYDKKAEEYGNPFTDTNDWLAIRRLNMEIKNPDSIMIKHAPDFALYKIGKYDTKTGIITADTPPRHVDELTNIIGGN